MAKGLAEDDGKCFLSRLIDLFEAEALVVRMFVVDSKSSEREVLEGEDSQSS